MTLLKYLSVALLLLAVAIAIRLVNFDANSIGQQRTLRFEHLDDSLAGTLILPPGKVSPTVVLLVHGDGAQDRWSEGGYLPLVNFLVSQGFAVFSWDKPGVGESRGNWLAQTMADRADEAAAMLINLRREPELKNSQAGFLGFSQAGWVVPSASEQARADFAVLVGPAINWREQGTYYLRQRLLLEGASVQAIADASAQDTADFDRQFTPFSTSRPCAARCTREDFERRNALADARTAISTMSTPVMILMGSDDRNVDPHQTLTVWQATLPQQTPRCLRLVMGATHGLLRSRWFDYQLSSQWPWWKTGMFLLAGQESYAPGALSEIADWAAERQCQRRE